MKFNLHLKVIHVVIWECQQHVTQILTLSGCVQCRGRPKSTHERLAIYIRQKTLIKLPEKHKDGAWAWNPKADTAANKVVLDRNER